MKLRLPRAENAFRLNLVVTFLGFLDTHMLIPIIALYATDLGAGVGVAGLIVGLYSVTNTPANILFGRIIDRIGYRKPLVIGLLGDAIGMFGYALCRLPFHLALVRSFHGLSGGLVGPATMSVTARQARQSSEGRSMGLYGMAMGMAVLVGYGLSGTMASRLGYDFIFYVGSAALLLAVFVALAMPRNGEPAKSGPHTPLRQDLRATAGMLRRRGLTTSYCCIFAQYFAFGGVVTLLPIYVEDLGMEAFHVGMLLATFAVVYGLLQFHSGAFSDRRGRRLPVTVGLCLSILSLTIMPSLQTFALLAVVMAVYGTAYALLFPSISALIADRAAPDELGRATGMFHALLTAGVALGAPVMGWTGQCIGIEPGLALTAVAPGMALIITQLDLRKRT